LVRDADASGWSDRDYGDADAVERALSDSTLAVNCIANVHGADRSRDGFRAVEVEVSARTAASRSRQTSSIISNSSPT